MGKVRKQAVPHPREGGKDNQGTSANTAAGNALTFANGAPIGPAATAALALAITPRIGGKIMVSAFISGSNSVPGTELLVTLRINGVAFRTMRTQAHAATGNFDASMSALAVTALPFGGFPVGVAVTADILVISDPAAGAITIPINQASITLQEVPVSPT